LPRRRACFPLTNQDNVFNRSARSIRSAYLNALAQLADEARVKVIDVPKKPQIS
jgi:hypothetical protein